MKLRKKAFSILMASLIVLNSTSIFATSSINMVGTNNALGSPLLNTNFNPTEFKPEENIIFGIFLSNFPIPLVDSYQTAFSRGAGGSDGYGFRALQFASGAEETMENMLNLAIDNTIEGVKASYKPLYLQTDEDVSTEETTEGETGEETTVVKGVQATLYDFLNPTKDKIKTKYAPKATGDILVAKDTMKPNKFYVNTDVYGKSKHTMFDYSNAYDVSMLLANLSRVLTGNTDVLAIGSKNAKTVFKENLTRLLGTDAETSAKMFMDAYGNLTVRDPQDGKMLIVFPACANQYLTEKLSQNYVTSVFVGPSYLDGSSDNFKLKLQGSKSDSLTNFDYLGGGKSAIGGDGNAEWYQKWFNTNSTSRYIEPGTILMYYDSDTYAKNMGDTDIHFGNLLLDLIDSDIDAKNKTNTELKISIVGGDSSEKLPESMKTINNYYELMREGIADPGDGLHTLNTLGKSEKPLNIFGDSIVIVANSDVSSGETDSSKVKKNKIYNLRMYLDYFSDLVSGKVLGSGGDVPDSKSLRLLLQGKKTIGDLSTAIYYDSTGDGISPMFKSYTDRYNIPKDKNDYGLNKNGMQFNRLIKVITKSETMSMVSAILGGQEDAEFGRWTPMIYQTYLEWYGLIGKKNNKLDTSVYTFDNFKMDIAKITTTAKTDEEIKQMMATYLDPVAGRELRHKVNMGAFYDTFYDWYKNMVKSGGLSGGSGFLNIDTYAENPITASFIKYYTMWLLPITGVLILGILIVAMLKKKNVGWVVISTIAIVNLILIMPTIGDMVPFVSGKVQDMIFKDRLDFWGISESAQNANIQSDEELKTKYGEDISKEVYNLVKTLNMQNADSSLMLRWDISKKVTETSNGDLNELQKYQSTKWMIPSIIGQYTANDKSADYVYVGMTEALDNIKYMYWYYNKEDMLNGTSSEEMPQGGDVLSYSSRLSLYPKHKDTKEENYEIVNKWEETVDEPVHKFFYMLPDLEVPSVDLNLDRNELKTAVDEAAASSMYATSFETAALNMEFRGGTYSSWEPSTIIPEFGYMWTTESPLAYFYMAVKDSFLTSNTFGKLITDLQGEYNAYENQTTEESREVRENFMYNGNTGYLKDLVDFEEFFTNVVPYVYTTQIVAGGLDGESGVFGDKLITNYELYTKNKKSWLFRSNWATKLMESKLNKEDVAKTSDGKKFRVKNPMLPESYTERAMVFSEAQMNAMGLTQFDLTKVELRVLEANKRIADRWTLLINYANLPNMNKEIIYGHMALIATTEFNDIFSPGGLLTSTYSLYPRNIELRNVSFDSIMRMLMLNATRDTTYAYGDVMYNFIENADVISVILLLLVTFGCLYIIPLAKMILSAIILFAGLYSSAVNLFSSSRYKAIQFSAYLVNLGLFVVLNTVFYGGISALMGMASPSDVLKVSGGLVDIKSPAIVLLVITLLSIGYCIATFRMSIFLIKNRADLGASKFTGLMEVANNFLANSAKSVTNGVTEFITGDGDISGSTSRKSSSSDNVIDGDSESINKKTSDKDMDKIYEVKDNDTNQDKEEVKSKEAEFIDAEIDKGKGDIE